MYKLLNMADFYSNKELEKDMQYFSKKYGFDGYELKETDFSNSESGSFGSSNSNTGDEK